MNCKQIVACVLALGVTTVSNAAQAPAPTPDFVFTVPLNLQNLPGEVHTVVVWCEALNATYGRPGEFSDPRDTKVAQDESLLQFRAGPRIIASTGAISIRVNGGLDAQALAMRPTAKPLAAWSVDSILMTTAPNMADALSRNSSSVKPVTINANKVFSPDELANLMRGRTHSITPKAGASSSNVDAVALIANTAGATDPALGTAFACHMGFKATAMVDGKPTDFDIFAGPGSYEGMPDENAKDPKFIKSMGRLPNPYKVLHVYGNFPAKAGKPAAK